jgi:hypothetical protein
MRPQPVKLKLHVSTLFITSNPAVPKGELQGNQDFTIVNEIEHEMGSTVGKKHHAGARVALPLLRWRMREARTNQSLLIEAGWIESIRSVHYNQVCQFDDLERVETRSHAREGAF